LYKNQPSPLEKINRHRVKLCRPSVLSMEKIEPIAPYNIAFFRLYEAFYKVLTKELGPQGFTLWKKVLRDGLFAAYDAAGAKKLSGADEFMKFVGSRDAGVGLKVDFEKTADGFIYRFYTDPFPGLKGLAAWSDIVESYLAPKTDYFLGPDWSFRTTKHLWDGADCTEHVFVRKM